MSIKEALDDFAAGKFLIVTDDESRENEGDLIVLAEKVTSEQTAFMVRHTTGILCVAIDRATARRLELPMMYESNQDVRKTAFTVSVDAAVGTTTGVSAIERTRTINLLASTTSAAKDFIRPGHIFPLVAHEDGLAARGGHTEAGIALAQLVGASPAALLSEIVNDDGSMARGDALREFAAAHQIKSITIEQLTKYWRENHQQHTSTVELNWSKVQLPEGLWELATYPALKARDHVIAKFGTAGKSPLVRVHSECFTGDVLGSMRCDCGEQLALSKKLIADHGYGFIIYIRDHEGRGVGLAEKLKAYQLQDQGLDTVEANLKLGHPIDAREWSDVIEILKSLHLDDLTLLTNNPEKVAALTSAGFTVTQRNLAAEIHEFNRQYIETKRAKLGHERGNA
ncbi:bifunctional 3,4-dihydroxy-2-butanone 4-phosphate synthase/GTP cyclohydrolase II protein [Candidatus Nanopelagicaceae bacterium]